MTNHQPPTINYELHHEHDWNVTSKEATAIQKQLEPKVRETPLANSPETVAGLDVSIRGDLAQAAVAVWHVEEQTVVAEAVHRCEVPFPYVPGLLSFREMPAILPALDKLDAQPDAFMTDSHGRAHPRRFGLACHLGVVLDWPLLGVAKSRLTGERRGELDAEKGSRVPLTSEGSDEVIGTVLRTRTDVKPVFVSVGHRLTLRDAEAVTLSVSPRYKIPEPTRRAHKLSRRED